MFFVNLNFKINIKYYYQLVSLKMGYRKDTLLDALWTAYTPEFVVNGNNCTKENWSACVNYHLLSFIKCLLFVHV